MVRVFDAVFSELEQMMAWVRTTLHQFGMSPHQSKKFEIALEEALVNIVQYAYPEKAGSIEIRLHFNAGKEEIEAILIDYGIPFNPLVDGPMADLSSSLVERREGGLGIHFMRKMTDQIAYKRVASSNILMLSKQCKALGQSKAD